MTLDKIFAECKQLRDEDLGVLLSAIMREQKERGCKKHKAAWSKVVEAVEHYTANYGNIRVADFSGDENIEIYLYHGQFAFSEYGDIEVGA